MLRFELFSLIRAAASDSSLYAASMNVGSRCGPHQIASAAIETAAEKACTQVDQDRAAMTGCCMVKRWHL